MPPPAQTGQTVWSVRPRRGFGGEVCIDGSALDPTHPDLCRAGWAAVAIDGEGRDVGSVHGPVPLPLQEIGAAEPWSVHMVLHLLQEPPLLHDHRLFGCGHWLAAW